ncbi:MAG TPA: DinB family protein [Actinomycetota bacterium]|nr:DinB family protein [Actinomycetota bacterium]
MEIAPKRTFAAALDWPGWCRPGVDSDAALAALFENGPRYGRAVASARLGFRPPRDPSALRVVQRVKGNATTDFGAPGVEARSDRRPLDDAERRRSERLLRACWRALDQAAEGAAGRELRKGPRGGGRSLAGIVRHVVEAEEGYLNALGWKPPKAGRGAFAERMADVRGAVLEGLAASARGEIAPRGPRGGVRWRPRYFVRRVAWHALDHAWEIEDRMMG